VVLQLRIGNRLVASVAARAARRLVRFTLGLGLPFEQRLGRCEAAPAIGPTAQLGGRLGP
jgi:hypothetical protein